MLLIEPCCTQKHLLSLRSKLGENGTSFFHGYGDLSMAEMLPAMLTRYCEAEMTLAVPTLPNGATETVMKIMRMQRMSADGKKKLDVIKHLTLVADLRKKKSPEANVWLTDNPFGDRLTIINTQQNDTAIILPDIAFFGNINLTYGNHFTAIATKHKKVIAEMKENLLKFRV